MTDLGAQTVWALKSSLGCISIASFESVPIAPGPKKRQLFLGMKRLTDGQITAILDGSYAGTGVNWILRGPTDTIRAAPYRTCSAFVPPHQPNGRLRVILDNSVEKLPRDFAHDEKGDPSARGISSCGRGCSMSFSPPTVRDNGRRRRRRYRRHHAVRRGASVSEGEPITENGKEMLKCQWDMRSGRTSRDWMPSQIREHVRFAPLGGGRPRISCRAIRMTQWLNLIRRHKELDSGHQDGIGGISPSIDAPSRAEGTARRPRICPR
jgi:hypothetical protein